MTTDAPTQAPGQTTPRTGQRLLSAWAAARRPAPHPVLRALLALAVYLAVYAVCFIGPLLSRLNAPVIAQSSPDPNFYVWSWAWWPYAISHGLNPLFSAQIGAPAGYNLAWTTPTAAVAVLLSPVTELFGPIVSFNLATALAAPVSAWAAFLAARQLTGKFWPALAGGAVYGFSWYEVTESQVGHPNLCLIMMLPLTVYLAALWRDGKLGPRGYVALQAPAMAVEFYIFNETFVWMTALWAALLLAGWAVARPAARSRVVRLAQLTAMAWVAAVALASPYLIYALRHAPAQFDVTQNPRSGLDLHTLVHPWYGLVLLAITLALAVFARRSRLTWLLVIGLVLVLALAVGPDLIIDNQVHGPVPWSGLWRLPFAVSSQPKRLMIFASLLFAMIVAVWLADGDRPARGKLLLAARWALGLIAVAGLFVGSTTTARQYATLARDATVASQPSYALPLFFTDGAYRDYLRPGETVVVVSDRGNAGMLFQAYTDFYLRLSGGFINAALTTPSALPTPVAALEHPSPAGERVFLAYLRRAGVGAVLVDDAWAEPWMDVFGKLGLRSTTVGGVTLYR